MSRDYLHNHPQFADLLRIVALERSIGPALVEKDYWIMHCLWCVSLCHDQNIFTVTIPSIASMVAETQALNADFGKIIRPSSSLANCRLHPITGHTVLEQCKLDLAID